MTFGWSRPAAFVNARVVIDGTGKTLASSIRFNSTVLSIDEAPQAGDEVVDLDGAFVLPGLINAHDHLELNHYGPLKVRSRYDNATQWIDDLRPALQENADIRRKRSFPLRDRLFIGGLKNVLAGVTTVAHHNPVYRQLDTGFPVRVVRRFGWAHSFQLEGLPVGANGEPGPVVRDAYASTPDDQPFVVHAAEGVDRGAADEIERLKALACLRPNTVIVHGLGMDVETWRQILTAKTSLVWCPASNAFLFGRTIPAREFLDTCPDAWMHLCIGTDSRVTGSIDLLEELREAQKSRVTASELFQMVTTVAARVLRLGDAGSVKVGGAADLVVIPAIRDRCADALLAARRADISCVIVNGRPTVATPPFDRVFRARRVNRSTIRVDGGERLASAALLNGLKRCPIVEPGVEWRGHS